MYTLADVAEEPNKIYTLNDVADGSMEESATPESAWASENEAFNSGQSYIPPPKTLAEKVSAFTKSFIPKTTYTIQDVAKPLTYPAEKIIDVSEKGRQLEDMANRKIEEQLQTPSDYPVARAVGLGALKGAMELAPKTPEQGLEYALMGEAIPYVSGKLVEKFPVLGKSVGEFFGKKAVQEVVPEITQTKLELQKNTVEGVSQSGELPIEKVVETPINSENIPIINGTNKEIKQQVLSGLKNIAKRESLQLDIKKPSEIPFQEKPISIQIPNDGKFKIDPTPKAMKYAIKEFGKSNPNIFEPIKGNIGEAINYKEETPSSIYDEVILGKKSEISVREVKKPFGKEGEKLYIPVKNGKDMTAYGNRTILGSNPEEAIKLAKEFGEQPKETISPPQVPPIKPPTAEGTPSIPPSSDEDIVIKALKEATPLRGKQEELYTQARGEKLGLGLGAREKAGGGEAGFISQLASMKGELPKVTFESIRSKVGQENIDNLFNKVTKSPLLTEWEKIPASKGLSKLFGEYGGSVPTENEIELLSRVFSKEFTDELMKQRPLIQKLKEAGLQIANIPRALMASFDLSAPMRQGILFATRPKEFIPAFRDMFKFFANKEAFNDLSQNIVNRPTFPLMRDNKLALTNLGRFMNKREERFMSSLAEKIPVAGKIVEASNRAYSGFLNKLRADVFDRIYYDAEKSGLNPSKNKFFLNSLANFINTATGRGSIGTLEREAPILNALLFSPRLMYSRINTLNPLYYIRQDPTVRKEALYSLLSTASALSTILGVAKLSGVAEVETDPRSADFGKMKIGNTRIDMGGGFQQYLRLMAQLFTGEIKSTTTGKILRIGEGYKPLTRYEILQRFAEYKEAPVASFVTNLLKGKSTFGNEFDLKSEVAQRFIPMVIQDFVDIAKDDPSLLPLSALGVFGVGLQTYKPQTVKEKNKQSINNFRTKLEQYRPK